MAYPKQTQIFSAARGDHEGINVVQLPDWFSPSESQNLRFTKNGRVEKILGFTAANSTAVTTNTGGSATEVHSLFEYWGGASTPKVIGIFVDLGIYGGSGFPSPAGDEYELWVSSDAAATWTFGKDMGQHGTKAAADFRPMLTAFEYNDKLYIPIHKENPQQYDGTSFTDAGPTQSPTPTLAVGAAGTPSGVFECRIVSLIGKDRQAGSAVSAAVHLNSEKGSVTWTADSNTNVTGYEVYFTTGTGVEFYYVATIDGRTTTSYTMDLSDAEIRQGRPLDRHGDAPPNDVRIGALWKDRGWWGRTEANPSRLYYSDPFKPDEVSPNSFFDVEGRTRGEDALTGLFGGFQGSLVVFKRNQIFVIGGSGEILEGFADFSVRETSATRGSVGTQCIVEVPAGARFINEAGGIETLPITTLAYWAPDNTIRVFDGDSDRIISYAKKEFLQTAAGENQQWHFVVEHDPENQEISWFFTTDNTSGRYNENNVGVMWNYREGAWSELSNCPFGCALTTENTSGEQLLLCGTIGDNEFGGSNPSHSADGEVYINKSGNNYNGTNNNITAEWWTKPLLGVGEGGVPIMNRKKRLRRLEVLTTAQSSSQNLSIEWYGDYADSGATASGSATVDMNGSNVSHVQNRVDMKNTNGDYLSAKAPRLRFFDVADDAAWAMPGFALEYQVLVGGKEG